MEINQKEKLKMVLMTKQKTFKQTSVYILYINIVKQIKSFKQNQQLKEDLRITWEVLKICMIIGFFFILLLSSIINFFSPTKYNSYNSIGKINEDTFIKEYCLYNTTIKYNYLTQSLLNENIKGCANALFISP